MVIHDFICDNCNITIQDTDTKESHRCPKCGETMRWDLRGIAIHGNYKHPIHSDSLGIQPSQRAEHEKMFPNIRLDEQNRPIFEDFVSHENYLKRCNLVKHRQRIKTKGKKIATMGKEE